MNWLSFFASMLDSLAWPATVLSITFFFKGQFKDLFESLINFKYKDFEFSFDRGLGKAKVNMNSLPAKAAPPEFPEEVATAAPLPKTEKELVARIADLSPSAAVIESWRGVERALDLYCKQNGLKQPISGPILMQHLRLDPHFPDQLLSAYEELLSLRNKAAHEQRSIISKESAMEFAALAERLALELSVASLL